LLADTLGQRHIIVLQANSIVLDEVYLPIFILAIGYGQPVIPDYQIRRITFRIAHIRGNYVGSPYNYFFS
jgi:hypothetical protein